MSIFDKVKLGIQKVLGINWRTTTLGIGVIVAAGSRILLAFRSKHFDIVAIADDGQLIATTAGALLMGAGLLIAKDAKVVGAGDDAKTVHGDGKVTDVDGEKSKL